MSKSRQSRRSAPSSSAAAPTRRAAATTAATRCAPSRSCASASSSRCAPCASSPRDTGVGTAAGAVLGGIAGSNVGGGIGQVAGAIGGAILGGIIGQNVEKSANERQGVEITVLLDSGKYIAVVQEADEQFRVGRPRAHPVGTRQPRASRTDLAHLRTGRLGRWLRWTRMAAHAAARGVRSCASSSRAPRRDRGAGSCSWWSAKLLRILNVRPAPRGPRAAARAARRDDRANHISWVDIFAHLQRAAHALHRQERGARLAGRRLDRRARGNDLHPPRPPPRHRAHQRAGARGAREGRLRGPLSRGHHDRGRPPAQVPHARSSSPRSRTARACTRWRSATSIPTERSAARWRYVGELSFMQSLGLIIRQPRGRGAHRVRRGDRARGDRTGATSPRASRGERVASLLGLDPPGHAHLEHRRSCRRTAVRLRPQTQPLSSAEQVRRAPAAPARTSGRRRSCGPRSRGAGTSNHGIQPSLRLARLALEREHHARRSRRIRAGASSR